MATLTRRLQILLDEERYARLERAAARRGAPIAALVRDAIDRMFATQESDRRAAGTRLLQAFPMPVEDWDEMKKDLLYTGTRNEPR